MHIYIPISHYLEVRLYKYISINIYIHIYKYVIIEVSGSVVGIGGADSGDMDLYK
jgi:hypothetical protein